MQALIQQDAAAFAFPGRAPATAGVVGLGAKPIGHDPAHAHDLAQFTALNQVPQLQIPRLGAELEHAGKDHLWVFGVGGDEAFGVGLVGRNRLLDHHMHSLVEGCNA